MSQHPLHTLKNNHWQVGILPGTGASIAYGRVRHKDQWVDVLRPTPEADYGNSSNSSCFIMLPWCNRIKDGLLRFKGDTYPLRAEKDDGTARHGDVRKRPWKIKDAGEKHIIMTLESKDHPGLNWPFPFSARAEYHLHGSEFTWLLSLKNEYERPAPGGFGYHPYFVRPQSGTQPLVQIPCDRQFQLADFMAEGEPVPITKEVDFRRLRALDDQVFNDLLTDRRGHLPTRIIYPDQGLELRMVSDPVFEHTLIYAPKDKPYFAVEPMTNASDGFNLYEQGLPGSGVFILSPGEEHTGTVILGVNSTD